MRKPDGRVDPNGTTYRYLSMPFSAIEQNKIEQSLAPGTSKPVVKKVTEASLRSQSGIDQLSVTYGDVKKSRRIVSQYSINVIKLALKESGMTQAVMTSTLRTPEDQAKIMLRNAKINITKQYKLYGGNGDKVIKVYEKNKSKSDTEITKLMVEKISALANEIPKKRVSLHCVSVEDYNARNIIDIGLNSTKKVNANFNKKAFTKALLNLEKEGYIAKVIDETAKSNCCWHIEVIPNAKSIANYHKGSILNQITYINRMYIC